MIKAVIFDFDGVLFNSREVQRKALNESYRLVVKNGQPSFEEFLSHSGDSIFNILKKMGLPEEMAGYYLGLIKENAGGVKIYDGINELLDQLRRDGFRLAICTGRDKKSTMQLIDMNSLNDYFDVIVCADDVLYPKPNPQILNQAVGQLDMVKESCVMIGDSCNDLICAKNAGVKSIAVGWGDTSEEVLKQQRPDFFVRSPEELYECIKGRELLLSVNY
ncbi:HAD family hydrolase [Ruminiclostridium cellobioparum]|uniref:HAD family hydrolase n=2 Tax=Ruminiclostridium cellobioparum TaxID=29355 RepID=UPI000482BF5E|nr:HAD family hydrolase [Ruminiclostridium cellobioparum]